MDERIIIIQIVRVVTVVIICTITPCKIQCHYYQIICMKMEVVIMAQIVAIIFSIISLLILTFIPILKLFTQIYLCYHLLLYSAFRIMLIVNVNVNVIDIICNNRWDSSIEEITTKRINII